MDIWVPLKKKKDKNKRKRQRREEGGEERKIFNFFLFYSFFSDLRKFDHRNSLG